MGPKLDKGCAHSSATLKFKHTPVQLETSFPSIFFFFSVGVEAPMIIFKSELAFHHIDLFYKNGDVGS